nr:Ycf33 family protein [Ipomoea batatas]
MRTLRIQFHLKHPNFKSHSSNHAFLIQTKPKSHQKHPRKEEPSFSAIQNLTDLPSVKTPLLQTTFKKTHLQIIPKSQKLSRNGVSLSETGSNDEKNSRILILGAVSIGVVMFLMGVGDEKALALGPEGPLMEEFWDNMRRYAIYALTVSTGVLYTVFQPIYELLKNPISAILVLTIIGGSIFIVSQVLSAMVGVSDFSYEYSY